MLLTGNHSISVVLRVDSHDLVYILMDIIVWWTPIQDPHHYWSRFNRIRIR